MYECVSALRTHDTWSLRTGMGSAASSPVTSRRTWHRHWHILRSRCRYWHTRTFRPFRERRIERWIRQWLSLPSCLCHASHVVHHDLLLHHIHWLVRHPRHVLSEDVTCQRFPDWRIRSIDHPVSHTVVNLLAHHLLDDLIIWIRDGSAGTHHRGAP